MHHARCYMALNADSPVTHEEAATLMFNEGMCTFHAAHVVWVRAYEDGRIPTDTCACGGRNKAGYGDHATCKARIANGTPLQRLDILDAIRCGCYNCEKERKGY